VALRRGWFLSTEVNLKVHGSKFEVQSSKFKVQSSGFKSSKVQKSRTTNRESKKQDLLSGALDSRCESGDLRTRDMKGAEYAKDPICRLVGLVAFCDLGSSDFGPKRY
jgi:hypothetical protein